MNVFQILLSPFVWILMFFYNMFSNYGVALLLFAFLVKLILFPFSIKGKRGMIQSNMVQSKVTRLQKQYGADKTRYNEELQKLYERENVNPMSGCLWNMIPLLVLLPLYAIIREPMTYMMSMSIEQIRDVAVALNWDQVAQSAGWITQKIVQDATTAAHEAGNQFLTSYQNAGYNQLYLSSLITPQNLAAVQAAAGEGAKTIAINFNFLGLNLAQIPTWKFWVNGMDWATIGLFLMPLISAVSGFFFSLISMKTNAVNQQSAAAANNASSKMMLLMSPIMSLWIGFSMPASLCIYWIAQNIFSMLQEFVASKILKKDYEKAAADAARREAEEKEEERIQKELDRQERARRIEDAKHNKGKKLPQKKVEDDKIPAAVKEASREGMRTYARGRGYDPKRFAEDGPTPYADPDKITN